MDFLSHAKGKLFPILLAGTLLLLVFNFWVSSPNLLADSPEQANSVLPGEQSVQSAQGPDGSGSGTESSDNQENAVIEIPGDPTDPANAANMATSETDGASTGTNNAAASNNGGTASGGGSDDGQNGGSGQTGTSGADPDEEPNQAEEPRTGTASCGNNKTEPGEQCDDGGNTSGDGCSADCQLEAVCGNGTTDAGEACDDGNTRGGDGCSADCSAVEAVASCGDGHVDAGEACDAGGLNSLTGTCNPSCQINIMTCGDGRVQQPNSQGFNEECDGGDNCNGNCTVKRCGDGFKQDNEQCEIGEEHCSNSCLWENDLCDSGQQCIAAGADPEACTDSDAKSFSAAEVCFENGNKGTCYAVCVSKEAQTSSCGNGSTEIWEPCDKSNGSDPQIANCDNACHLLNENAPPPDPEEEPVALCGDGVTSGTELCDDHNTISGDGCSATCEIEPAAPAVNCSGIPPISSRENCKNVCNNVGAGEESQCRVPWVVQNGQCYCSSCNDDSPC